MIIIINNVSVIFYKVMPILLYTLWNNGANNVLLFIIVMFKLTNNSII